MGTGQPQERGGTPTTTHRLQGEDAWALLPPAASWAVEESTPHQVQCPQSPGDGCRLSALCKLCLKSYMNGASYPVLKGSFYCCLTGESNEKKAVSLLC